MNVTTLQPRPIVDGAFRPFRGFHPFYFDMGADAFLMLLADWRLQPVELNQTAIDADVFRMALTRGNVKIEVTLDLTQLRDTNHLLISSISNETPLLNLPGTVETAQGFADCYGLKIEKEDPDLEHCAYYECDGNPSVSMFESDGVLESVCLLFDDEAPRDR